MVLHIWVDSDIGLFPILDFWRQQNEFCRKGDAKLSKKLSLIQLGCPPVKIVHHIYYPRSKVKSCEKFSRVPLDTNKICIKCTFWMQCRALSLSPALFRLSHITRILSENNFTRIHFVVAHRKNVHECTH